MRRLFFLFERALRVLLFWSARLAIVAAALLAPACSSSDDAGGDGSVVPNVPLLDRLAKESDTSTSHGVGLTIGPVGARKRIDLKPVTEVAARPGYVPPYFPSKSGKPSAGIAAEHPVAPGLRPADVPGGGGSGGDGSSTGGDGPVVVPDVASSWIMVFGALAECDVGEALAGAAAPANLLLAGIEPVVPTWRDNGDGSRAFAAFPKAPASCDEMLAMSQALVCAADKIEQTTSAFVPATWKKAGALAPKLNLPPGDWTFSAQKTPDKFIGRMLVAHLLANVAILDMTRPTSLADADAASTCAELYGRAVTDGGFAAKHTDVLFGGAVGSTPAYFPPATPLGADSYAKVATSRLLVETHILRAASRLLHDVTTEAKDTDVALAASAQAGAVDPISGGRAAWGTADMDHPPYGTLSHANRVLFGRLELGTGALDRACSGMVASDQLRTGYGPDLDAITDDAPIATQGQRDASFLVDQAGIVLAESVFNSQPDQVRQSLTEALTIRAAVAAGVDPADPTFLSVGQGAVIAKTVAASSDDDLRFAFGRQLRGFRVQNESSDAQPQFTKIQDPCSIPAIAAKHPILCPGHQCDISPSAHKQSRVFSRSPCSEPGGPDDAADASKTYDAAFASTISLSQTFYRRLVVARETAAAIGNAGLSATAQQGAAEARGSFGGRRAILTAAPDPSDGTKLAAVHVKLLGYDASDFAGGTDALTQELVLVGGATWKAACVTGASGTGCPADFEQTDVAYPTAATVAATTDSSDLARKYGTDGLVIDLDFDASTLQGFARTLTKTGSQGAPVFVALRHDPRATGGAGRVLGAVVFYDDGSHTSVMTDAGDVQAQDIFLGGTVPPTGVGDHCTNVATFTCVQGLTKDKFIALQNDLTPGADAAESSWKYYVNAAKVAADKADQLANQLIAEITQVEQGKQQGQEELAAICGDFGALGMVQVTNGVVTATSGSEALRACLNEDTEDVVLVTNDPTDAMMAPDRDKILGSLLNCAPPIGMSTGANSNPLCKGAANDTLTHAGLGLTNYDPPTDSSSDTCSDIATLAANLVNGSKDQDLAALAKRSWAQFDGLSQTLGTLRISQDTLGDDGDWTLSAGTDLIMSSAATSNLFPGCLRGKAAQVCNDSALYWSTVFRPYSVVGASPCPPMHYLVSGACLEQLGSDPTITTEAQESHLLLWRVETAIAFLTTFTGKLPGGVFDIALPAANYGAEPGQPSLWSPGDRASLLTLYGAGEFAKIDDGGSQFHYEYDYGNSGGTSNDAAAAGHARVPAAQWFSGLSHSQMKLDVFRRVYNDPQTVKGKYVHIRGANQAQDIKDFSNPSLSALLAEYAAGGGTSVCASTANGTDGTTAIGAQLSKLLVAKSVLIPQTDFRKIFNALGVHSSGQSTNNVGPTTGFDTSGSGPYYGFSAGSGETRTNPPLLAILMQWPDYTAFPNAIDMTAVNDFSAYFADPFYGFTPDANYPTAVFKCEAPPDPMAPQETLLDPACSNGFQLGVQGDSGTTNFRTVKDYQQTALLPSVFPPGDRVVGFLPFGRTAISDCDSVEEYVRAMALACRIRTGPQVQLADPPPAISSLDDISKLEYWVSQQGVRAGQQLSILHLEHLPKRVIEDFAQGRVGSGALGGTHGQAVLQLEQALQDLVQSWIVIAKDLQLLSDEIRTAHIRIAATDIQKQLATNAQAQALAQLTIQSLQVHAQEAQAAAAAVSSISALAGGDGFNPAGLSAVGGAVAGAESAAFYGQQELDQIGNLINTAKMNKDLQVDEANNQVLQALSDLQKSTTNLYADLQNALSTTRSSVAQALSLGQQVRQTSAAATYAAAKAASFGPISEANAVVVDGVTVDLPVNTILRRQGLATTYRYKRQLADAKQLACIARFAIEQRIGARLPTIPDTVDGDATSSWADEVASMQGIDYSKLTTHAGNGIGNGAEDTAESSALAREFIGDYVQKLDDLVTIYDVAHPFAKVEDVTVLSLSRDLLSKSTVCYSPKSNRLLFSGGLDHNIPPPKMGLAASGWLPPSCPTSGSCPQVLPGQSLPGAKYGPLSGDQNNGKGMTWFAEIGGAGGMGGSGGSGGAGGMGGSSQAPGTALDRMVTQSLDLEAGTYVLSWWDESRGSDGSVAAQTSTYRFGVFDALGTPAGALGVRSRRLGPRSCAQRVERPPRRPNRCSKGTDDHRRVRRRPPEADGRIGKCRSR